MECVRLNNGVQMPLLGFGTAGMNEESCETWVSMALNSGYRMIDTAAAYMNEAAVGRAIRKSGVSREELFITTKLWIQDSGYENTKKAFQRSLERLGLEKIDLYMIHQPIGDIHGSWRALEELYQKGKIRALGVSNFEMDRLADLMLFQEILPAVNQLEVNLFCQQHDNQMWMQQQTIQTEAWGIFAQGKEKFLDQPVLTELALKYKKTAAQIMLRWLLQRKIPVVFHTRDKIHLEENLQIFDFSLTQKEMDAIRKLDMGRSIFVNYHLPETVVRLGKAKFDI